MVDQKDIKIRKLEVELGKARDKIEKVLAKTYLPSANEIVQGLSGKREDRADNIVRGSQAFDITHPLNKHPDMSDLMKGGMDTSALHADELAIQQINKEWADEMRKADERAERFRREAEEVSQKKHDLEERFEYLEKSIATRDDEILRLNSMYSGGQNLEKLNLKFI